MPNVLRSLRAWLLTPGATQARLDVRGFHAKDDASRELLETVGRSFLAGYRHAAAARTPAQAEQRLETFPWEVRGFAYEGAAMSLAIMDGLSMGGGRRIDRFLAGRADRHVYMVHVGVGWAMARLPRWRWPAVLPTDPLLSWLALDGYGFHQAYFHPDRYVRGRYREAALPWPADRGRGYAHRVVDQGIGRAMWFVHGADPTRLAAAIDGFEPDRHADLYSGAGLAATYAGGAGADELAAFWRRAGEHRPAVAQGCAFAAQARVRAGLVTAHTALATATFCGTTPERAAAVTDDALAGLPDAEPAHAEPAHAVPNFELWRRRIADAFVSLGRC